MGKAKQLRLAQIAKLPPAEQQEYRSYRSMAIGFAVAQLMTLPLISWPIIYWVLMLSNGGDSKLAMLQTVFSSALPLLVLLTIFASLRGHYTKKAVMLRLGTELL
ncbi:MAG: hypothetical protein ACKOOE_03460 [Micrococcales bacterium]